MFLEDVAVLKAVQLPAEGLYSMIISLQRISIRSMRIEVNGSPQLRTAHSGPC